MESSTGRCQMVMKNSKPYIAMLVIQSIYAGMALFSKAAITKGMNPHVFVVYRQAFATLALAPFAFFLERNNSTQLSYKLQCKIFLVSLFGITLCLNLYYFALNYTSATVATASTNTIPAITFIMAVLLRKESMSIGKLHGLAKVLGSMVGLSGALVIIFFRGPPLNAASPREISMESTESLSKWDWIKGSLIMLLSNTTWSWYLIMQGSLVKQYPAKLRLTALQCFYSCIQAAVWAVAIERNISSWKLGWDFNLLSVVYCGIIVTAISYWLRIWVIEKKGPVFVATFTPLALIITAIFSAIFWKETLHWGSVCGSVLLVGGLYSVLWGKHRERKAGNIAEIKLDETKEQTTDKWTPHPVAGEPGMLQMA